MNRRQLLASGLITAEATVRAGFVANKMTLGQVSFPARLFSPVNIISTFIDTLSGGGGGGVVANRPTGSGSSICTVLSYQTRE
jgi:hypothetical protein